MTDVRGYEDLREVHQGARSRVFRGKSTEDGGPVIIKTGDPGRLRGEWQLLQTLQIPGVVRARELVDGAFLVLEDAGSENLSQWLGRRQLSSDEFLRLAIQLAEILARTHARAVIHLDLNPWNILVDAEVGWVTIGDFAMATRSPSSVRPGTEDRAAHRLRYIAPEQTGRLSHGVDHRTDLYALGCIFYEMLTGRPPFQSDSGLGLLHAHIALTPAAPHQDHSAVPESVSRLVMRLLAKTPEERYPSAEALQADLLRIRHSFARVDALADVDAAEELQLPDRLYGRDAMVAQLEQALDGATQHRRGQVRVLTGPAGIGKTALAMTLERSAEARGGQLVVAKFDQLRGAAPYAALGSAIRQALLHLLEGSDGGLHLARIGDALDGRASALVEFLPELGALLQTNTVAPELGPAETRHRFERAVTELVGLLSHPDHPLVLVLDDVHWADQPSLSLVRLLSRRPPSGALLVITTRDDSPVEAETLALPPLERQHIAQLVADTLGTTENAARALADLIQSKTGGNAFFVRSMLRHLHAAEYVRHDENQGWTWDLLKIGGLGLVGGADALMEAAITRLEPEVRELLQVTACIGNQGSLSLVGELLGLTAAELRPRLRVAENEGLLALTGEQSAGYRFTHDQVQRAAIKTLSHHERSAIHLLTGRTLLHRAGEELDEHIFEIVDQLELGRDLIIIPEDRARLARLNTLAARRARRSSAHGPARDYLLRARGLQPRPTFDIELALAEACHLSGDSRLGDRAVVRALALARDDVDRAAACRVQSVARTLSGDYPDALDWGRQGLDHLGFVTGAGETEGDAVTGMLGDDPVARITSASPMTDARDLAAAQLLVDMATPSYFTDPPTFGALMTSLVRHSLERGHSEHAAYGYVFHGMMLAEQGHLRLGHEVGLAAIGLAEQEDNHGALARVLHTFANHLNHWVEPARSDQSWFERATRVALEAGELQFASYATSGRALHMLSSGAPLDEVLIAAETAAERARQVRDRAMLDLSAVVTQFVRCMRGETDTPGSFDDADFSEAEFLVSATSNPSVSALYDILRLQASVLLGDWEQAAMYANAASTRIGFVRGMLAQADHVFYTGLVAVAKGQIDQADACLSQLRLWEHTCPANFRHRADLVEAEIARFRNQQIQAMEAYDRAADAARAEGFLHEEALANQLAARFHNEAGRRRIGRMYASSAARARRTWGAGGPELADPTVRIEPPTSGSRGAALDMHSVLKAAEAISSEVVLERLLDKLMQVCMEAAGAERAVLLLENQGQPVIRALGWVGQPTAATELDLDGNAPVSLAMVADARASAEALVLDDAVNRGEYRDDPYVKQHGCRSILVLPIRRQGTLVGLFWFENNLVTGAFTKQRLQVLRLLSAQIASSLENSLIFEQLMDEIRERAVAEAKLRRSDLRMTALFDHAPDVFILWDPMTRRVTQVNDAARKLTGHPMVDESLNGLFTSPSEVDRMLAACETSGGVDGFELELVRVKGDPVPVLVNATLVTDGKKALYGQAVVRDVRHLKAAEEALRQANETLEERVHGRTRELEESNLQLETSNAELRQFAYLASHDLKSPIRVVSNYLQLIERRYGDQLDETGQGYIQKATAGAVRMQSLIDDVLAFSQVGRDRRPFAPVDTRAILGNALENLQSGLDESEGFVELGPMPKVFGNAARLTQLFQNLLENALKYRGEAAPEISVNAEQRGPMWEFAVTDNGIGIDPDQDRRIFVIFKRLHNRKQFSGTGIGLAICKKIVEMHGGTIWVESEGKGHGCTFKFTLPRMGPVNAPG